MRTRFAVALTLLLILSLTALAQARDALSPYVVQRIKDAVVYVDVTLTLKDGSEGGATGSGFVISKDGEIVTNAHVVSMEAEVEGGGTETATARKVTVTFHSGTGQAQTYDATVERENHEVDLALLKINLATPNFLVLADSDTVEETSPIYVCGHPLGLKEISIRSGSVTAHRTWEGRPYIEHDAMAESGNSGGPVVDQDGRIIGIHTLTLATANNMTKFAIPSNVLRDWLATPESHDPAPVKPGANIKQLLERASLKYKEDEGGYFRLPYGDDITVSVHQYQDFLRVFVRLGEIPGDGAAGQGETALKALKYNYDDPVGRMSVWSHHEDDGSHLDLDWECQIPMSVASPEYLKTLADVADDRVANWEKVLKDEAPADPDFAFPGGDESQLLPKLKAIIQQAKLTLEDKGKYFNVPYDNDVTVHAKLYKGMAYTYCYIGGMPGANDFEKGQMAIWFLERNWDDSFGRLALDGDSDLVWESQIPLGFLTPDYFSLVAGSCSTQVADFWSQYGKRSLNGT